MSCNCNKEKRSYHFHVSEVVDGKVNDVMSFNFGGHHDLGAMARRLEESGQFSDKHAKELVIGLRFLHHVAKKYPDNAMLQAFHPALEELKKNLKETYFCK